MISAALRKYPALVKAHKARAAKLRARNGKAKRKRNSLFGPSATAKAKRVKKIVRVQERDTKEAGEVVQVLPGGWLKVKWDNRQRPTLIKRSEIKRYPYLRSNPGLIELAGGLQAIDYLASKVSGGKKKNPNLEDEILKFLERKPNADINEIARAVKVKAGPSNDPLKSELNQTLKRLRDNGQVETGNQWGAPRFRLTRRNPSVTEMSKRFQGRATGKTEEFYASDYAPRLNFSRGGKLVFLKLGGFDGTTIRVPGAVVAIDPKTEKLWIAGSDARGLFKRKAARKGEVLDYGEIDAICYLTAKQHIGSGKTYEYVHEFGEEGGRKPRLLIDHEGMPIIKGGSYKIKAAGIVD